MKIVRTIAELENLLLPLKEDGKSVGFVPTMGALHKGHLSLVAKSKNENDYTVVSVFVNPTQFNDKNDLKNYPRTEEKDSEMLSGVGCDIMFLPSVEEVYPQEDNRSFNFGTLESVMEGAHRPGHFNGVAQVVSKLFSYTNPTRAYFGEKDFQQLAIIRQMAKDLALDLEIVGCPIVRADDGLALSSRNELLSDRERFMAPVIYMILKKVSEVCKGKSIADTISWVKEQIEEASSLMSVEYFSIVDATTLQDVKSWSDNCTKRGCIAVKLGNIRLIDNIEL